MFGVYTSPINSDCYLRHDIVFADNVVEHARIRMAQGRMCSLQAISNCGRPSFSVVNSYGEVSIHDWYTEHAVGRTLPLRALGGYVSNAAIASHGTFSIRCNPKYDHYLTTTNELVGCESLDSKKMMVEAHGDRLYVISRRRHPCYEPMGEILPCGWYVPSINAKHTYANLHAQCAYDTMVAYAQRGVLTCVDTRMNGDDIAFQVNFNSCPVDYDNTHCVFVSETMIGMCDLVDIHTDYSSRLIDMRFPCIVYDLQSSGKKAPRRQRIFACA